jgi:hypothetical protein
MEASAAPTRVRPRRRTAGISSWASQLRWFAVGAVAAFFIPFVFSSVLELQHDLYLGVYFAFVIGFVGAYVRSNEIDVRVVVKRNWRWGVLLGVVVGVALVRNVFSETETARPDGFYFAFEVVWRGLTYGAVDALLLTVFPCLVVYQALGGSLGSWRKRIGSFVASLALVITITASDHLGYDHYRESGVRAPETGNVLISMPMLLTANPIGSVADHAAMHVAAVIHEYEDDTRLPPQTDAD